MIMDMLINKLLLILFIMSCLNVLRHVYYFIQAWVRSETDNPVRYIINGKSLWVLSVSLSYIVASMFSGIYIKI